jgi:hypothetical protein
MCARARVCNGSFMRVRLHITNFNLDSKVSAHDNQHMEHDRLILSEGMRHSV